MADDENEFFDQEMLDTPEDDSEREPVRDEEPEIATPDGADPAPQENLNPEEQALVEQKGGDKEDWQENKRDEFGSFNGNELLAPDGRSMTKEIEATQPPEVVAHHHDMLAQMRDGATNVFLPDYREQHEHGETLYVTQLIVGENGRVDYRIDKFEIAYPERHEAEARDYYFNEREGYEAPGWQEEVATGEREEITEATLSAEAAEATADEPAQIGAIERGESSAEAIVESASPQAAWLEAFLPAFIAEAPLDPAIETPAVARGEMAIAEKPLQAEPRIEPVTRGERSIEAGTPAPEAPARAAAREIVVPAAEIAAEKIETILAQPAVQLEGVAEQTIEIAAAATVEAAAPEAIEPAANTPAEHIESPEPAIAQFLAPEFVPQYGIVRAEPAGTIIDAIEAPIESVAPAAIAMRQEIAPQPNEQAPQEAGSPAAEESAGQFVEQRAEVIAESERAPIAEERSEPARQEPAKTEAPIEVAAKNTGVEIRAETVSAHEFGERAADIPREASNDDEKSETAPLAEAETILRALGLPIPGARDPFSREIARQAHDNPRFSPPQRDERAKRSPVRARSLNGIRMSRAA